MSTQRKYKKREYTPAQKAAFAKKMAAARAAKANKGPRGPKRPYTKKTTEGNIGSILGGTIGGALGGPAGSALGTVLGKGAHQLFTHLTGFGDYQINGNTLLDGGMSPPMIKNAVDKGGVIVRHREYLQDIDSTVLFTRLNFPINPGLPGTFPWLSTVASCFEEYKFRGLVFEFKSLSSDAVLSSATSSALGAVIMATDYNVLNPLFANKSQMENYEFANSAKPSLSFCHPVECKKSQTPNIPLYVRTPATALAGSDQRLYDLGMFQVATVGMQAASGVAGEIWCTYEIEFYKPRLTPAPATLTDHFELQGTINGTNPFGTTAAIAKGVSIGGSVSPLSTPDYQFPLSVTPGDLFQLSYLNVGATGAAITAPLVTYNKVTEISRLPIPEDGVTAHRFAMELVVIIDEFDEANPPDIIFGSAGTVPDGTGSCNLIVTKLNPSYVP